MFKCHYAGETGRIIGFYSTNVHTRIPKPNIDLDVDAHTKISAAPKKFRVNLDTFQIESFTPEAISHESQRDAAYRRVDLLHARVLSAMLKSVTVEERGSWAAKEQAARDVISENATDSQKTMLASEASAYGITIVELAQKIIRKADDYLALIGEASALRAKARIQIADATHLDHPLDKVAARLASIVREMSTGAEDMVTTEDPAIVKT